MQRTSDGTSELVGRLDLSLLWGHYSDNPNTHSRTKL